MAEQVENAMTVDWWWEEAEYGVPLNKRRKEEDREEEEADRLRSGRYNLSASHSCRDASFKE